MLKKSAFYIHKTALFLRVFSSISVNFSFLVFGEQITRSRCLLEKKNKNPFSGCYHFRIELGSSHIALAFDLHYKKKVQALGQISLREKGIIILYYYYTIFMHII